MIQLKIDPCAAAKPFPHYWELCVGSCHAYTALREDYRAQLRRAHEELGFQYVRFHGLLDDDMSVCYEKKDVRGNSLGIVYNFANVDNIFDFLLSIGMKPFIELGFMPSCLASGTKTCFHYHGNVTPPKSYDQWSNLISAMVRHLTERYTAQEVRTWFFEVWNEPNLPYFFAGTQEDYFRLYDASCRAVKAVDPSYRVGSPATSVNSWIPEMIAHCEQSGVPLDFLSTHHYPTDDPLWESGQELGEFLAQNGGMPNRYRRGTLTEMTQRTREQAGRYPLYYTEWNTSANNTDAIHDEAYTAALAAKTIADNDGLVKGYSFWTFTDIFEENAQGCGPFNGCFGLQTYEGIAKPVYRLFQLYHGLSQERLPVAGAAETVEALACRTACGIQMVVWNHNVPEEPCTEQRVAILLAAGTAKQVRVCRIDAQHCNPKGAWQKMGSPQYLSADQLAGLHQASELVWEDGSLELTLAPQSVAMLDIRL
jgi:xylan 1,4-beta-xylosidase